MLRYRWYTRPDGEDASARTTVATLEWRKTLKEIDGLLSLPVISGDWELNIPRCRDGECPEEDEKNRECRDTPEWTQMCTGKYMTDIDTRA